MYIRLCVKVFDELCNNHIYFCNDMRVHVAYLRLLFPYVYALHLTHFLEDSNFTILYMSWYAYVTFDTSMECQVQILD